MKDFLVEKIDGKLSLISKLHPEFQPICIDFLSTEMKRKKLGAATSKDLLIKAVGAVKERPKILDCTLGLGTDSFLLQARGCEMWACERNEILRQLWKDAASRAKLTTIQFQEMDAKEFLTSTKEIFDCIYLDPMYPEEKRKSAQKKEMVVLRELLGSDPDADALLALALEKAKKRVVVKRPLQGKIIGTKTPSLRLKGKAVRFDVYLNI